MEKHILVALPLSAAQRDTIRQAVPGFQYRFTTQEAATREEILWADAILGNVPVELIRQNRKLAWFQSTRICSFTGTVNTAINGMPSSARCAPSQGHGYSA